MRFIVHGVGAIGGTVAGALADAGKEVIGIARGAQLDAIRARGLTLRTPRGSATHRFDCFGDPAEAGLRPGDVVLLCMKTQDTAGALVQLAAAGLRDQPVFCVQNGVENERLALRRFPNVHCVTVLLPADFITPGEVAAFGSPNYGIFDIGRYPSGTDADDRAVAEALTQAGIPSFVQPDVMSRKYGKLLMNLGNIVEAALGKGRDAKEITDRLRGEAEAALRAAGIAWHVVDLSDPRLAELMTIAEMPGIARVGGSSTQSLTRGAGSIETDYLNGEIVLLGRLHGVPVPLNAFFLDVATRMLRDKLAPGSISRDEIDAALSH